MSSNREALRQYMQRERLTLDRIYKELIWVGDDQLDNLIDDVFDALSRAECIEDVTDITSTELLEKAIRIGLGELIIKALREDDHREHGNPWERV